MAKKQTFGDKLNKGNKSNQTSIKLIRSFISEKTGSVCFSEDMLHIPEGQSIEKYIKDFVTSK